MASKPRSTTPPTTRPAAPRTKSPAAASASRVTSPNDPGRPAPSDEQIRDRAYYLWEAAGRPEGDGMQFWLEAEQELNASR